MHAARHLEGVVAIAVGGFSATYVKYRLYFLDRSHPPPSR